MSPRRNRSVRGAWEMKGWGFECAKILGRADSLGGGLNTCQEWTDFFLSGADV